MHRMNRTNRINIFNHYPVPVKLIIKFGDPRKLQPARKMVREPCSPFGVKWGSYLVLRTIQSTHHLTTNHSFGTTEKESGKYSSTEK